MAIVIKKRRKKCFRIALMRLSSLNSSIKKMATLKWKPLLRQVTTKRQKMTQTRLATSQKLNKM